jgi:hypothetical protein
MGHFSTPMAKSGIRDVPLGPSLQQFLLDYRTVVMRIGLRFRVSHSSSQIVDCSLNVTPNCCVDNAVEVDI